MEIVKKDKKRIWCPGCGLFLIEKIISDEFVKLGWNKKNTVIVSGIGCTARIGEYFNVDSMHVLHGRTIPVAEGVKMANPNLNVVIISGDGDLLGIGGNHLIHAIQRNPNISVFCNSNRVYAMTGGQSSPTTTKGEETKTSPGGYMYEALDIKPMFSEKKDSFFARTHTLDLEHFKKATRKTLKHKGFSFLEIVSPCAANLERKLKTNDMKKVLEEFKKETEKYKYEKL